MSHCMMRSPTSSGLLSSTPGHGPEPNIWAQLVTFLVLATRIIKLQLPFTLAAGRPAYSLAAQTPSPDKNTAEPILPLGTNTQKVKLNVRDKAVPRFVITRPSSTPNAKRDSQRGLGEGRSPTECPLVGTRKGQRGGQGKPDRAERLPKDEPERRNEDSDDRDGPHFAGVSSGSGGGGGSSWRTSEELDQSRGRRWNRRCSRTTSARSPRPTVWRGGVGSSSPRTRGLVSPPGDCIRRSNTVSRVPGSGAVPSWRGRELSLRQRQQGCPRGLHEQLRRRGRLRP